MHVLKYQLGRGLGQIQIWFATVHLTNIIISYILAVMEGNEFQRKYKQMNMLGKGNYGKVYKVRLNDGKEGRQAKYYVAKKMYLQGLSEQEIKSAFGEIQILQKLNKEISSSEIPFVVSYNQFFRIQNELIIIMEFCQSGELSTYLKNLKKNGQRLNQKIIAYWFIQLLFGVKALHSKNILHRDLKSANIFLTKNYSLKIGDFGISKVLERSSAITCIGTPLYLSPEVCNNQPYGLSSDLWALGCVIYEMCTLRYPFQASNMIVLAKKIVMDDVEPIPTYYSRQLNDIVMRMFIKDNKKRITVEQILKTPYIINAITSFVNDQGKLQSLAAPIPNQSISMVKNQSNIEAAQRQEEETMKTINSVVEKTGEKNNQLGYTVGLTKVEERKLKRQQETLRNIEMMTQAVKKNAPTLGIAKQEKQKNLNHTSGYVDQSQKKRMQIEAYNENKAKSELKFKAKEMEKMQTINLTDIANTLKNLQLKPLKPTQDQDDFEEIPLPANSSYVPINTTVKKGTSNSKFSTISTTSKTTKEEIAQQIYEDDQLQEYYDDDFEDYEEENSTFKALEKTKEKENILAYYQNQLNSSNLSPTKREKVNKAFQPVGISNVNSQIQTRVQQCQNLVGTKRYNQLYKLFSQGKINFMQKSTYKTDEKRVLFLIEQIRFFQGK